MAKHIETPGATHCGSPLQRLILLWQKQLVYGSMLGLLVMGTACSEEVSSPTAADPSHPIGPEPVPDLSTLPNSWISRAPMPTARKGLVAASVNGIVYAIGGWKNGQNTRLTTVEAYNPATTTLVAWTTKAPLPAGRYLPNGAAVINGKIYVPGGLSGLGPTRSLFVYNPATNSWTSKALMPIASYGGASAAIDGKLYVLATGPGTEGDFSDPTRLFRYDPATNTWMERAQAPHHHHRGVARAINGKLYVAGGMTRNFEATSDAGPEPQPWAELDVYDPALNTWVSGVAMPEARYGGSAGVVNGKLYVAGGWKTGPSQVSTLEVYDPATNTWAARADMPTARGSAGAAVVNGVLYVLGGGGDSEALKTNEAYFK
jgi:N-acetylneuraminic acid mutarotase